MKLKRITQTFERFILSLSLTRNIDLDALSHKPLFSCQMLAVNFVSWVL